MITIDNGQKMQLVITYHDLYHNNHTLVVGSVSKSIEYIKF